MGARVLSTQMANTVGACCAQCDANPTCDRWGMEGHPGGVTWGCASHQPCVNISCANCAHAACCTGGHTAPSHKPMGELPAAVLIGWAVHQFAWVAGRNAARVPHSWPSPSILHHLLH